MFTCICAVNDGTTQCPAPQGMHIWGKDNPLNDPEEYESPYDIEDLDDDAFDILLQIDAQYSEEE